MLMLLVEMGSCHGVVRKALWGPCRGGRGVMVKCFEARANTKDCPQVPRVCVSAMGRWFSFVLLWKKFSLVFIKPRRRARVQKFCIIRLVHAKAQSGLVFVPIWSLFFTALGCCIQAHVLAACTARQALGLPVAARITWLLGRENASKQCRTKWVNKCVLPSEAFVKL